jgi:hypothetical protein
VPVAVLVAGAYLADLLWPVFLLAGIERVRIVPGLMRLSSLDFVAYPWSHSLVMLVAWGALAGGLYARIARDARGGVVVSLAVVSHWVLDLIVHRPDLPIVPGGARFGFGLWNVPAATIPLESLVFVTGVILYLRATRARGLWGHVSFWSLTLAFAGLYVADLGAPPPPSPELLARFGLLSFLFVPWCMWVDGTRAMRTPPANA